MTSFLFLLKNGLIYHVWFDRASRVLCVYQLVFSFGSLDIIGGYALLNTRDDTTNQDCGGLIWRLCPHPNI